jgi:hypothetical protein
MGGHGYLSKGALAIRPALKKHQFKYSLPEGGGNSFVCSFWFFNARRDLVPRISMVWCAKDKKENVFEWNSSVLNNYIKTVDGNWALAEISFHVTDSARTWYLDLECPDMDKEQTVLIDKLMIRPEGTDVYLQRGSWLMKNNRYYNTSLPR